MRVTILRGFMLSLLGVGVCTFLPQAVFASELPITITEVHPNPITSGDKGEWIELINISDLVLNASDITIDSHQILSEATIEPRQIFIITNDKEAFDQEFGVWEVVFELPISLKNTGDLVEVLFQLQSQQIEYPALASSESWEIGVNECSSFGRSSEHSLGYIRLDKCNDPSDIPDLEQVSIDDYIGSLILNEIMPNPDGKDSNAEWVELWNKSDQVLALQEVRIYDSKGIIYSFDPQDELGPFEYFVATIPGSKLNNCESNSCSEQVSIVVQDQVVDSFIYGDSASGVSWSLGNDSIWSMGYLATQGSKNIRVQKEPATTNIVSDSTNFAPVKPVALSASRLDLVIPVEKSPFQKVSIYPKLTDQVESIKIFLPIWPIFLLVDLGIIIYLGITTRTFERVLRWWNS